MKQGEVNYPMHLQPSWMGAPKVEPASRGSASIRSGLRHYSLFAACASSRGIPLRGRFGYGKNGAMWSADHF